MSTDIDADIRAFKGSARPLLSCIILLTANDLFVQRQLIPRIIRNSGHHPIEILVVCNGDGINREDYPAARLLTSEYGCVAKGYNAGVRSSRGEYVAIFHDDCTFTAPDWIDRCIAALDREVIAVTPQIIQEPVGARDCRLPVAKDVPLFMRRSNFDDLGGYDEFYYAGIEDVDFTQAILSRGRRVAEVDIGGRHFGGMSTVMFLSRAPELYRELFAGGTLGDDAVRTLRSWYLQQLMGAGYKQVLDRDILYFMNKYEGHLQQCLGQTFLTAREHVAQGLSRLPASPLLESRELLIEFYRKQRFAPPPRQRGDTAKQQHTASRLLRFVRHCVEPGARERLRSEPARVLEEHGFSAALIPAQLPIPEHLSVRIDPPHLYGVPSAEARRAQVPPEVHEVLGGSRPMILIQGDEHSLITLRQWAAAQGLSGMLSPFECLPMDGGAPGRPYHRPRPSGPARAGSGQHRVLLLARDEDTVVRGWLSMLFGWDELLGRLLGDPTSLTQPPFSSVADPAPGRHADVDQPADSLGFEIACHHGRMAGHGDGAAEQCTAAEL